MASSLGLYLSLCFIFIFILLGGGTTLWSQALGLGVTGLLVIFFPPQHRLSKYLNFAVLGLIVTALLSFLPIPEFLRPTWWIEAKYNFELSLPITLSSQPLHSLEALILMLSALAWLYVLSSMELGHAQRKTLLWGFAIGIFLLSLGIIIGTHKAWNYPFGREAHNFSYFNNRNQTSILLAMGGVISFSLSMAAMRARRYYQILFGIFITFVTLFALIYSHSKAGILLFFIGCIFWLFSTQKTRSIMHYARLAVPLIIILGSFFVFYGGWTLERVILLFDQGMFHEKGYRWLIYQDTFRMISDQSLLGVGLTNFKVVFPQYREISATFQAILHPESDWFWVWAELGLLGVVFILFACGALIAGVLPANDIKQARYRMIAATAVFIFFGHTFIDVSGHRMGTFYAASFLYALARRPSSSFTTPFIPLYIWRLIGILFLITGLIWGMAWLLPRAWHSSIAIKINEEKIERALTQRDNALFEEAVNNSLFWSPMNMRTYFNRTRGYVHFRVKAQAARSDFRRARFLEPITADVAFYEGLAWMPFNSSYTLSAWREALARKTEYPMLLYRLMLRYSKPFTQLHSKVRTLSSIDPAYRYTMLISLRGDDYVETFRRELDAYPHLSRYSKEQKQVLFEKWVATKELDMVSDHLEKYPELGRELWLIKAQTDAARGDYVPACKIVLNNLPIPQIPQLWEHLTIVQLER